MDDSIYSVDTAMSNLESSAGSRLGDVFVDPSKGSARFYSAAPAHSLGMVPEETALLNRPTDGAGVGATTTAPPSEQSEVEARLIQNGDIDDSMLESAAAHNRQMALQTNNNNASGETALKRDKPSRTREDSVQSDDGVSSPISPYCQVSDLPNGSAGGTAPSAGGYVHLGSMFIAGAVDNRNNANNSNNGYVGGASSLSDGDNVNDPFLIAEEPDNCAVVDRVPTCVASVTTPTPTCRNNREVGRTQPNGNCGNNNKNVGAGTNNYSCNVPPRLNSAGYVTETPSPGPNGSPLRPTVAAGGYVTLNSAMTDADSDSCSGYPETGTDDAATPQLFGDTHSSVNASGHDVAASTGSAVISLGASQ